MSETPKEIAKPDECEADEPKDDSWGDDQKKREYYYDDSHGYEEYDPNEPEVEEED